MKSRRYWTARRSFKQNPNGSVAIILMCRQVFTIYSLYPKITSLQNETIKNVVAVAKSRKLRQAGGVFVAEGARLCGELPAAGIKIDELFFTPRALAAYPDILEELFAISTNCFEITEDVAGKISSTEVSQGVIAVCQTPVHNLRDFAFAERGKYLFLEQIADPGNLGSLIRTAAAFGVAAIVATENCADFYNPKVVRAAMGGHFKLPLYTMPTLPEWIAHARDNGVLVYATALAAESVSIKTVPFEGACAVVVGSEANGLLPETVSACTAPLIIPMLAGNESLGAAAAGAIAIWELCKAQL